MEYYLISNVHEGFARLGAGVLGFISRLTVWLMFVGKVKTKYG
jgi:hypothetical protein